MFVLVRIIIIVVRVSLSNSLWVCDVIPLRRRHADSHNTIRRRQPQKGNGIDKEKRKRRQFKEEQRAMSRKHSADESIPFNWADERREKKEKWRSIKFLLFQSTLASFSFSESEVQLRSWDRTTFCLFRWCLTSFLWVLGVVHLHVVIEAEIPARLEGRHLSPLENSNHTFTSSNRTYHAIFLIDSFYVFITFFPNSKLSRRLRAEARKSQIWKVEKVDSLAIINCSSTCRMTKCYWRENRHETFWFRAGESLNVLGPLKLSPSRREPRNIWF